MQSAYSGYKQAAQRSQTRQHINVLFHQVLVLFLVLGFTLFSLDLRGTNFSSSTWLFLGASWLTTATLFLALAVLEFKRFQFMASLRAAGLSLGVINASVAAIAAERMLLTNAGTDLVAITGICAGAILTAVGYRKNPMSRFDIKPKNTGPLDDEKLKIAAIHEAGHALTLGILPSEMREGSYVTVRQEEDGIFTARPVVEEGWDTGIYLRWEMLMLLAGPLITEIMRGDCADGGSIDLAEWQLRAGALLTAERTPGWTQKPISQYEVEVNHKLLDDLMDDQEQAIEDFFNENRWTYDLLVDLLVQNRFIPPDDLAAILDEVHPTSSVRKALTLPA